MSDKIYRAAMLVIGDEILSGRTQDVNVNWLARWLSAKGVRLSEVRIVPDDEAFIVAGLNSLRHEYDYVFTTGGIGPTHDDITAECVAKAFRVPLDTHPDAYQRLNDHYTKSGAPFTDARQRMARIPSGGTLIDNPVSVAPGFQVENVFVMAGVPKIMQGMLDSIADRIVGGAQMYSKSLKVDTPESAMADLIGKLQDDYPDTQVGSYPFYRDGVAGVEVVIRGVDQGQIDLALAELSELLANRG